MATVNGKLSNEQAWNPIWRATCADGARSGVCFDHGWRQAIVAYDLAIIVDN